MTELLWTKHEAEEWAKKYTSTPQEWPEWLLRMDRALQHAYLAGLEKAAEMIEKKLAENESSTPTGET